MNLKAEGVVRAGAFHGRCNCNASEGDSSWMDGWMWRRISRLPVHCCRCRDAGMGQQEAQASRAKMLGIFAIN